MALTLNGLLFAQVTGSRLWRVTWPSSSPTPRRVRKTYEVPRAQDGRRLLEVIKGGPLEALVYLALGLGLRRAEVLGLRWEDVDFENRIITLRTRVNWLGKGVGLLVRDGLKTQPERRIATPRLVAESLHQRWPRQLETRLHAGDQWRGPNYAESVPTGFNLQAGQARCCSGGGQIPTSPTCGPAPAWAHIASTACATMFASLLLAAGVADRVVMEMMGLSNIAMTANRYQHVPDELQQVAASRLDDLFLRLAPNA